MKTQVDTGLGPVPCGNFFVFFKEGKGDLKFRAQPGLLRDFKKKRRRIASVLFLTYTFPL